MSQADHGRFDWYELQTTDTKAALAFYPSVLGWEAETAPMGGGDYTMFKPAGGQPLAGVMTLTDQARQMGAPSHWLGYIAVGNVDATAKAIQDRGGRALSPPFEVEGVGRMQVMKDPWGAVFALHEFATDMAPPTTPGDGQVCWHELLTGDLDGACAFYGEVFGWTRGQAMDMGPMGIYQIIKRGDLDVGGFMKSPPGMNYGAWMYYVAVPNLEGSLSAVTSGGGKVCNGPMPIPGGSRIAQFEDPQGAALAVLGP